MEGKGLVLCFVVALLGIISAATGFAAEFTRIKASDVQVDSFGQCSYPPSPALVLGLTAAATLLIAQIIINFATGCFCCKRTARTQNSNWTKALLFYVVSWFTFVIAFILLLTGAVLNDRHGAVSVNYGFYYCYVVKPGVFAVGAALAAVSVIFGILYYQTLNSGKNTTGPSTNASVPNQASIAMAQPQFPPHSSENPAFVHKDAYSRHQFT